MVTHFKLPKDDIEYMLKIAVEHYSASRWPEAERMLRGILAIEPDEWRAWQLLGSILLLQGFRIAADAVYRRCLEINPDDMYSLAAVSEIALDAMRYSDAEKYMKRLFELDPEGKHSAANRMRYVLAQMIKQNEEAFNTKAEQQQSPKVEKSAETTQKQDSNK
ncbi:MAG: hypothetical protein JW841_17725 [Deltaproteobacteria bacterium]|nr:hypothetical protein [Deltaproteobacteria bacterium]